MTPNKPDAVNPAMALRFAIVNQRRRVTDLDRWRNKSTLKPSSNRSLLIARVLLGVAVSIILASVLFVLVAPRVYLARSRAKIEPYNWNTLMELSQPAFRDSLFGSDSSIRLVAIRGTSLIEVNAEADTPRGAANQATRAIIQVMEAVTRKPGFSAELVELSHLFDNTGLTSS